MIHGKTLQAWCSSHPLIDDLVALRETRWFNPHIAPAAQALADVGLSAADVSAASARLARFAPYLGYAVAAERLAAQFEAAGIKVDAEHPLFVYLPCGVGGGPGGVAFGLKLIWGDHVHCIFAEPTHSPCMFLGVYSGLHDATSVQDFGIDNLTAADGLAVGRPSGFVGKAMQRLLDGYYTVNDEALYRLLVLAHDQENARLEPSALAGMPGMVRVLEAPEYLARMGLSAGRMQRATHLVWGTGGSMVPEAEFAAYLAKGRG